MTITGNGVKQLEISRIADADLCDILEYGTKLYGLAAADAYYDGILATFDLLCAHPEAGQIDEDTALGLRRWSHRQHRIFYRNDGDKVLIVRIFHHSVDLKRHLEG